MGNSAAAFAGKLKQGSTTYGILYEGELKRPNINARWSKDQILNQQLELVYNGKVVYGPENNKQAQETIVLKSRCHKTQDQIKSVQESPEFKKCQEVERAGRRLSPICIKVRNQAGSLDRAEINVQLPTVVYQSPVLSTIEDFVKAVFFAHYKQMTPSHLPVGQVKLDLAFARAGDLAHVVVEHSNNAYNLTSIRIPYPVQGVMPLLARNPIVDVIEQKLAHKYAPASCRIEPSIISTFDNRTYAYKINECEHVLLTDAQRVLPVAVLAKEVSAGKKMVKVLAGELKIEVIPQSNTMQVKINGALQGISGGLRSLSPKHKIIQFDPETKEIIAEIKHYVDGVFSVHVPLQMVTVMTDGKSVEVVAPQILKNRAAGLCGDMNGEEVADLKTPLKCVMKPKLVALSYMLNEANCHSIPQQDLAEFQREEQQCIKETFVKTPIMTIFERVKRMTLPLISTHKVEKQMNKICISKEKVKTCGGLLAGGLGGSGMTKSKMVKYACVSAPSSKAEVMGGGYGSGLEGGAQGMGGGYGSGLEGGATGMGGGYGSGSGRVGTGMEGGIGSGLEGGANGMGGNYGVRNPPTKDWPRCAFEDQTCFCNGQVAYGTAFLPGVTPNPGWWKYKNVRGSIKCSNRAFGNDPFPNIQKECRCLKNP